MPRILGKPHLIIVAALMTVVLGGYAYTKIPADLLPQFDTPAVQIVCFYPGMPPEVMEKDIMSDVDVSIGCLSIADHHCWSRLHRSA